MALVILIVVLVVAVMAEVCADIYVSLLDFVVVCGGAPGEEAAVWILVIGVAEMLMAI